MSTLPIGWDQVQLGNITNLVTSGSRGWARYYTEHSAAFLRVQNVRRGSVNLDWSDIQRVSPPVEAEGARTKLSMNDLLITITADLGRVGIFDSNIDAYVNQHIALVRLARSEMAPFVSRFLVSDTAQQQLGLRDRGVTRAGLGLDDVRAVRIPIPPLSEQQRVVTKIDRLSVRMNQARDELDRARALIDRYRAAKLSLAYQAASKASSIVTIGEITEDFRYGTAIKCHTDALGAPVLRIPNVSGGKITISDLKYGEIDTKELNKLSLRTGDILMIRSNGSPNLVGVAAQVVSEGAGMAFAGYLIRIRTNINKLDPNYLVKMLCTPQLRNEIEKLAKSTSGVHNININEIASLKIPLPTIKQQRCIAANIENAFAAVDRITANYGSAREALDKLDQSILAKAFRGELVPQDPNDEPASVLLDRIRAERAAAGPASKRGRRPRTAAGA